MKKLIVLFITVLLYSMVLAGCGNVGDWTVTLEPTCTEQGIKTRAYRMGTESAETETIPALGHDWGEWQLLASESAQAASNDKKHICNRCGKTETYIKSILVDIAPLTPVASSRLDISGYDREYSDVKQVSDGWICIGSVKIGGKAFGVIAKYNDEGIRLWEDYFGGSSHYGDYFAAVQELPDNEGYLATGSCYSVDGDLGPLKWAPDRHNVCLIKYNNSGKAEWLMDANYLSPVSIEKQGFVAVYGHKTNSDNASPTNRLKMLKLDFAGNIVKINDLTDDLNYVEGSKGIYTSTRMILTEIIETPQGYILFGAVSHVQSWFGDITHGPDVQVFIDKDFEFIKQEETEVKSIEKYILLDDGFIMIGNCGGYTNSALAKFDYQMNKLWELDLQYKTDYYQSGHEAGYPIHLHYIDMIVIDSKLYAVGATNFRPSNPMIIILSLDGEVLYDSGKLISKMESGQYLNIYPYKEGYLVRAGYHDYNGNSSYEWIYYEI